MKKDKLVFFMSDDLSAYVCRLSLDRRGDIIIQANIGPEGLTGLTIGLDSLGDVRGCERKENECVCNVLIARMQSPDHHLKETVIRNNCPERRVMPVRRDIFLEIHFVDQLPVTGLPAVLQIASERLTDLGLPASVTYIPEIFDSFHELISTPFELLMSSSDGDLILEGRPEEKQRVVRADWADHVVGGTH